MSKDLNAKNLLKSIHSLYDELKKKKDSGELNSNIQLYYFIAMNKLQKIKIEINKQQPIDKVLKELERLGYRKDICSKNANFVFAFNDNFWGKFYIIDDSDKDSNHCTLITLAQLKAMEK